VEEALPTAQALVRRAARLKGITKPDELEELDQAVGEVLCARVTTYDDQRSTALVNYAWTAMFCTATQLIGCFHATRARAIQVAAEGVEALTDSTDPFVESDGSDEEDLRALCEGAEAFVFDLDVVDAIEGGERADQLEAALAKLQSDERQAFVSRFRDDIKFEDIATAMAVDRSKVRRLIESARQKLRRLLLRQGIRGPED